MMSCKEVAALSSQYLDQELPLLQRLSLRLHLLACRTCRSVVRGMRSLMSTSSVLRTSNDRCYEELAAKLTDDLREKKGDS